MKKGKKVLGIVVILLMTMIFASCDFITKQITNALSGINDYKVPPTINTNTINFEITGIGTQMRAYDNFPSVTLFVKATQTDGTLITDLQEPDFFEAVELPLYSPYYQNIS